MDRRTAERLPGVHPSKPDHPGPAADTSGSWGRRAVARTSPGRTCELRVGGRAAGRLPGAHSSRPDHPGPAANTASSRRAGFGRGCELWVGGGGGGRLSGVQFFGAGRSDSAGDALRFGACGLCGLGLGCAGGCVFGRRVGGYSGIGRRSWSWGCSGIGWRWGSWACGGRGGVGGSLWGGCLAWGGRLCSDDESVSSHSSCGSSRLSEIAGRCRRCGGRRWQRGGVGCTCRVAHRHRRPRRGRSRGGRHRCGRPRLERARWARPRRGRPRPERPRDGRLRLGRPRHGRLRRGRLRGGRLRFGRWP